jgi:CRISPR-associated endonuclease Csy4
MMDYYMDIKLVPNKEMRENILLNQVYTYFHKRLYDLKSNNIAVSFPEHRLKLGKLFRIHADKEALEKLNEKDWLGEYKKFCKVSTIEKIPTDAKHRTVSRIQQNMTESKLRRLIKRGNISEEDIKRYRIKMLQGGLENPYVELVSMSNGKLHRRFLEFGEVQDAQVKGEFDLFGLSKSATIPWF